MNLSYYELFERFRKLQTHEERTRFLRQHDSVTMRKFLRAIFNPHIKFFINKMPVWKTDNGINDPTMADYHMAHVINKIYLFDINHPESRNLSYDKREKLLIQFLEGMERNEAKMFLNMLFKVTDIDYLTAALVREVWPWLLPPEEIRLNVTSKKKKEPIQPKAE